MFYTLLLQLRASWHKQKGKLERISQWHIQLHTGSFDSLLVWPTLPKYLKYFHSILKLGPGLFFWKVHFHVYSRFQLFSSYGHSVVNFLPLHRTSVNILAVLTCTQRNYIFIPGDTQQIFTRGGFARGPTPYPFIYHFSRERYLFRILSIDKWYPFLIPCLELCIPFHCCKCTVV